MSKTDSQISHFAVSQMKLSGGRHSSWLGTLVWEKPSKIIALPPATLHKASPQVTDEWPSKYSLNCFKCFDRFSFCRGIQTSYL